MNSYANVGIYKCGNNDYFTLLHCMLQVMSALYNNFCLIIVQFPPIKTPWFQNSSFVSVDVDLYQFTGLEVWHDKCHMWSKSSNFRSTWYYLHYCWTISYSIYLLGFVFLTELMVSYLYFFSSNLKIWFSKTIITSILLRTEIFKQLGIWKHKWQYHFFARHVSTHSSFFCLVWKTDKCPYVMFSRISMGSCQLPYAKNLIG